MAIDQEVLRRRAQEYRPQRPSGIAGLVEGAHRDPALGPWLTLESTLLAPVPAKDGDGWTFWSLVSAARSASVGPGYQPPWGAVRWTWPSGRIAQLLALDSRSDLAAALATARSAPASAWQVGRGFSRKRRDVLLHRVESALGTDEAELAELADLYADLLPTAAYPLYHALAPASAYWLHPAGPSRPEGPERVRASSAPTRPAPVAARLPRWLRAARELGEQLDSADVAAAVEALAHQRHGPFRLAVVGAARPLYALVNRMLDTPVLPVTDVLPPLIVKAGPERRLVVTTADGAVEHRLPEPAAAWEGVHEAGSVRLLLDDELLQQIDGELVVVRVEDPDAGPLLAGCDAVALVTSATAGLGMDERELLERDAPGRHATRTVVLVTQLERIDPDERADVVDYISTRAGQLGVAVVVPDIGVPGAETDAILALAASEDRETHRALRLTSLLADRVETLGEVAEHRRKRDELETAARRGAAERELDARLLDWHSLRNDLQQRANVNVAELRSSLLSYRADLLDRLEFDLKRSRDPRQWWEEEFAYRLRRDLEATVRRYEGRIERNVTGDLEWLDGRTRALFDRSVARTPAARAILRPDAEPTPRIDGPDLSRYRLGIRIAPTVAGLLGVLFIPGGIIAMGLASAAALAAGELKLQGMVNEQRALVAAELPRALDRAINRISDELSDRIHAVYDEYVDQAERTEKDWRDTELAAIHDAGRARGAPLAQLAADAHALHQELCAGITTIGEVR